jgi:predicted nucleic acid-binding protein
LALILDTNALSGVADGEAGAVEEFAKARQIAIPAIVLGEYRFGIALSRRRSEYERWLSDALGVCDVLDVGEATSGQYAELRLELKRAGTPIPTNDLWIAALCRQHALPILSRDRHFDVVQGVRRVNW